MHNKLRKIGLALVMTVALAGATVALPDTASARWGGGGHWGGGHWGGGHWHGGGWGWGGVGLGLGTGLLFAAAPYYGGYSGDPYYYDYGPYAYGYGHPYGYRRYAGYYPYRRHYYRNRYGAYYPYRGHYYR